ncbi:MAG: gephyrin-like molybdotransferase Glp [Candidatus Omnitrophota bacterium]
MISLDKAIEHIISKTTRLNIERIPVNNAIGYILAEDIRAIHDLPAFNKSAMDGYALCSADTDSIPVELLCKGIIKAGSSYRNTIRSGECVKIMTGSPLPEGADSVVMVENTRERKDKGRVMVLKRTGRYENICFKGEDIRRGSLVLKKGTCLRGPEVSIASSLGRSKISVYRKPSVAILNTGDEVVEPGNRLRRGMIYNSNGPMLISMLNDMRVRSEYLGIAKDEDKALADIIRKGFKHDIIILSGGVSMGDYDLVPSALKKCGVRKVFHKIKMKPGKPVFFGTRKSSLVFGVPGNPVSTYLTFLILIKPSIEKMMGKAPNLSMREGILKENFRQKKGRKHFVPVKALNKGSRLEIFPVKSYHGSADIASLSQANSFMVVDGSRAFLKKNSMIKVILW